MSNTSLNLLVLVLVSGKLIQLRELLLSYNRIRFVPEEMSSCENLERLELAMNRDLNQLPDQVHLRSFRCSSKT